MEKGYDTGRQRLYLKHTFVWGFLFFCKISINLRVYSGKGVTVQFSLTFNQNSIKINQIYDGLVQFLTFIRSEIVSNYIIIYSPENTISFFFNIPCSSYHVYDILNHNHNNLMILISYCMLAITTI